MSPRRRFALLLACAFALPLCGCDETEPSQSDDKSAAPAGQESKTGAPAPASKGKGLGLTAEAMELTVSQFMKVHGTAKKLPEPSAKIEGEAVVLDLTLDPPAEGDAKIPGLDGTRAIGHGSVLVTMALQMVEGGMGAEGPRYDYRLTVRSSDGKVVAKGLQAKGKTLAWEQVGDQ